MDNDSHLPTIAKQLEIPFTSASELRQIIVNKINHMIQFDFHALVSLLYRMDVAERKLNRLLELKRQEDAAELIFDLMIEREAEKERSRRSFKKSSDIPEDERW